MDNAVFYNIGKIIERDSKTSTYKFALLRGVIDIIQENSPYIKVSNTEAEIPFGLLIEKWILYYYPIFDADKHIPQINGNTKLAIEQPLLNLVNIYKLKGGFSAFYNDFKNGQLQINSSEFNFLVNKIRDTIVKMPMKYIGGSLDSNHGPIFQEKLKKLPKSQSNTIKNLIENYGTFIIPKVYYDAFKLLGNFINGQDSLLFKWAEFSSKASGQTLPVESVLNEVLKSPIEERNILETKKIYKDLLQQNGSVRCVWTNQPINVYDIDHLIPFSVWKNNDLWNLLPSTPTINNQKRDKIPTPELIENQKDIILNYWQLLNDNIGNRFQNEIKVALLGDNDINQWKDKGILQLQESCDFLINKRGFEPWKI